jgi:hypothetical protein
LGSTWIGKLGFGAGGFASAIVVALAAGYVLGGRSDFKPPQIQVPITSPAPAGTDPDQSGVATQLAQIQAVQQPLAGQTPKDIVDACKKRNPRSSTKQSECTRQELDGLEYLHVFPAGWNFESGDTDQTLSAIEAGNPGALMFQKCLREHGARNSPDGFPRYAKMKACLVSEQEAHNAR